MPDFYLLIPCYNNREGLVRSLQSINYPYHLYSVIIVDDGSDLPIDAEFIHSNVSKQMSVTIIRQEQNGGITKALNAGLRLLYSQGKEMLIARLDCGDTCTPERFYRQVSYLRNHEEIDLIGSWCHFKDPLSGNRYKYMTPVAHARILKSMYFRNVFIHPTVMWRHHPDKPIFYPDNYPHAEDYGFFNQILINGKGAVIPEYLVTCELNERGISIMHRQRQLKSRIDVVRAYGTNKVLSSLGVFKLWILLRVPYGMLFRIKKVLYSG